jgi:hypothetical protein
MFAMIPEDATFRRWSVEKRDEFPEGQNPLVDVFTRPVIAEIARSIGLSDRMDRLLLRFLLAATGEQVFRMTLNLGGPISTKQKKVWSDEVAGLVQRLSNKLTTDYAFSDTWNDRKTTRIKIRFSSAMSAQILSTKRELDKLAKYVPMEGYLGPEKGERTLSNHYMQTMVNGATEVFIYFRGRENVSRVAELGSIDGEFASFVRRAVIPQVRAYYPRYFERKNASDLFNRQIQDAVKIYCPTST